MAVKVIAFKVKADGKHFGIGETIEGLSPQDEARLIADGFAESIEDEEMNPPDDPPADPPVDPPNDDTGGEQKTASDSSEGKDTNGEQEGQEAQEAPVNIEFNADEIIKDAEEPKKAKGK